MGYKGARQARRQTGRQAGRCWLGYIAWVSAEGGLSIVPMAHTISAADLHVASPAAMQATAAAAQNHTSADLNTANTLVCVCLLSGCTVLQHVQLAPCGSAGVLEQRVPCNPRPLPFLYWWRCKGIRVLHG